MSADTAGSPPVGPAHGQPVPDGRGQPGSTPPQRPVRILLAAGAPLLRTGYRTVLSAEPDLHVVAEAGDGVEAVELARRLLPDVAILTARLPRLDAPAVAGAIGGARLPVRVLLLTETDEVTGAELDDHLLEALRAGVTGLLDAGVAAPALVAAVRAMGAGEAVLAPRLLRRLSDRLAGCRADRPIGPPRLADQLTDREREVLVHLAGGLSNGEIAHLLSVSETTVKTHVGRVLTKLGLRDRVQAVVLAYESGLVRPGGFPPGTVG
jgi:DNA-binding NarL/FixJ family response regulator